MVNQSENAPLNQSAINSSLSHTRWNVEVFTELDSTQTFITQKIPLVHGDVIVAEYQSAGRGRLDRTFLAEKSDALLFSFYLETSHPREEWGVIPLLAGMSLTNVLNKFCSADGVQFKTKWPNDVLSTNSSKNGKVAGVLTQTHGEGLIIGIGLNVCMRSLPVDGATSLLLLNSPLLDRNVLLAKLLQEFDELFISWESGENLLGAYANSSATIGKDVDVHLPGGKITRGRVARIGCRGELVLDSGESIFSGDVIHLYTS